MKAIFARYGTIVGSDCDTLEEAKSHLSYLEDEGIGFGICIYDEAEKVAYFTDHDIIGKSKEDVLQEKIQALKKQGIEPIKIEFYNEV